MREIGAFEAKNKLGTLLDWVENGEEVLITRRGKAVARLVPAEPGFDRAKARRAADGLLDARRRAGRLARAAGPAMRRAAGTSDAWH